TAFERGDLGRHGGGIGFGGALVPAPVGIGLVHVDDGGRVLLQGAGGVAGQVRAEVLLVGSAKRCRPGVPGTGGVGGLQRVGVAAVVGQLGGVLREVRQDPCADAV